MVRSKNIFYGNGLFRSGYLIYLVPFLYFVIMLFVSMTNRKIGDYGVETDFYVAYIPQARELLNGNLIIDQYRGPVYQVFLAIAGFFSGYDYFTAGKYLNVISASVTLVFTGKIISSVFNKEVAFVSVLLVSTNSVFWRYTYEPGTDMLFLVFYTSALYFILKNEELNNTDLLIAGFLTGFAYLTRYTGLSLIILVILIFTIQLFKKFKQTSPLKKHIFIKPILCFFIPVIIMVSVWGVITQQKTGEFFYNKNFHNIAYSIYKPVEMGKDEWESKHQDEFKSLTDVIFKDFGIFTQKIFNNFTTYFVKDIFRFFPKYLGIFAAVGLLVFILTYRSTGLRGKYYVLAGLIFYFQILLIFYSERFTLPLLPLYCFLIVRLFSADFLQRFNVRILKFKAFGIIVLLLLILNFCNSYIIAREEINKGPVEILTIREWMNKNFTEDTSKKSIMARKPHIGYYLDMNFIAMPYAANYEEFIKNVNNSKADFVFVSENEGSIISNDELKKNLFDLESPPEEFEIITSTKNPLTILYKVKR
ncbi:MAG: glycosyltransferase family 39 protein [Bacteroidota bacterium]|nr:glycosyltransferase family 39 protein [Bacteroidota bacterium]